MTVYLVYRDGENRGQFYKTREEAGRHAQCLNDIPDGVKYSVKEMEV